MSAAQAWRWLPALLLATTLAQAGEATPALRVERAERLLLIGAQNSLPALPAQLQETPAGDWQTVSLPDVAMQRAPLESPAAGVQTTWYRLPLPAAQREATEPLFFYLPRWQTVGQVALYGDGRLLWRSRGDPVWNAFNQPLWLALDALDGAPRPHELLLRMDSLAGFGGGISQIWLGPESQLIGAKRLRLGLQAWLPMAIGVAFLALGLFVGGIWLRRRQEAVYLLFFLASLAYTLRYLHYVGPLDTRLISSAWFGWLTVSSLGWLTLAGVLLNFRLCGRRFAWLEGAALASLLGAGLLTLPWWQSSERIANLAVLCYGLLGLILACALPILLWVSWRSDSAVARALSLLMVAALPLAFHDLLLQNYQLDLAQPYLLPYWEIGFCLLFSYVLYQRYLESIGGLERSQEVLAQRLAEREAELLESHRQLREVERRETLAGERQRLMRDMHDGLGSSLTGALQMAAHGQGAALDLEQALRDCLDELRLTLDSLEPLEADLGVLLGAWRYRLQPRLEASGLRLRWSMGELPALVWLGPSNALQVLRIVQEVVSNIVKHAQAREIGIGVLAEGEGILLRVSDDGSGFVPDQAAPVPGGRGLGNIRNRATALQGRVDWQRRESGQGTRFRLWLPLAAEQTTAEDVRRAAD